MAGCSSLPTQLVRVHKIDVVQGNVVTREQAQALRPGMPQQMVRDILGSPLVSSVFHADRWDYVFAVSRQGQPMQQRRLTVWFNNGVLERSEGDELPSETEFVASFARRPAAGAAPVLQASEEQLQSLPSAGQSSPSAAPVSAPQRVYPPLEPTGAPR